MPPPRGMARPGQVQARNAVASDQHGHPWPFPTPTRLAVPYHQHSDEHFIEHVKSSSMHQPRRDSSSGVDFPSERIRSCESHAPGATTTDLSPRAPLAEQCRELTDGFRLRRAWSRHLESWGLTIYGTPVAGGEAEAEQRDPCEGTYDLGLPSQRSGEGGFGLVAPLSSRFPPQARRSNLHIISSAPPWSLQVFAATRGSKVRRLFGTVGRGEISPVPTTPIPWWIVSARPRPASLGFSAVQPRLEGADWTESDYLADELNAINWLVPQQKWKAS